MGCGTTCVKHFFFAFNFIFWLLGLGVAGIGIYSRVQNDSWKNILDTDAIVTGANLLIISGCLVAIIGFLGCCGAVKKYQCMLITYAVVVLLIFLLEIGTGVYTYVKRGTLQGKLEQGLKEGIMKEYGKDNLADKGLTKAIDWFQKNVECCGFDGPDDWMTSYWHNQTMAKNSTDVPTSCCNNQKSSCNATIGSPDIFHQGCIAQGELLVKDNVAIIGGVGIGVAVIQLFGVVLAICLNKAFSEEKRRDGEEV